MDQALIKDHKPAWKGGDLPYKASYGKLIYQVKELFMKNTYYLILKLQ